MHSSAHYLQLRLLKAIDALLMMVPFAVCWFVYYKPLAVTKESIISRFMILVLFVVLYTMYGKVYDAFLVSYNRISEMVYSQVLAVLVADGISYLAICMMAGDLLWIVPGLLCIAGQILISVIW